ncbi:XRE family transcriptional regulator [endosymbiont GvMRE of Glomus versiforme]|uniref:XRE family transcriptional regulator n=1 Tax=endosymbiont GvMRE of Glomus versiforme TaxID=2039283 RepID=UPI000EEA0DB7|nr:XRE family transcriptional regulator [endosymbiont GvMRE of Glomus versiforme]RHZ36136.1 Transcriptional regulator [endosymbiont GvMRE of Glomus versiforme]
MMEKNNVAFLDHEDIIKELSSHKYKKGNIGLSPDASLEKRTKYRLCKSILAYQQDNKLSIAEATKKLAISEKKFYEIGRGNINRFSLEELLFYLEKIAPDCELGIVKNSEYPNRDVGVSWQIKN